MLFEEILVDGRRTDKGRRKRFVSNFSSVGQYPVEQNHFCNFGRGLCKKHFYEIITKTCLYSFDPLKPHFYTVKLGFTGVYINFLISTEKHSLWVLFAEAVLTSTHNLCFEQKHEKYSNFYLKIFSFW